MRDIYAVWKSPNNVLHEQRVYPVSLCGTCGRNHEPGYPSRLMNGRYVVEQRPASFVVTFVYATGRSDRISEQPDYDQADTDARKHAERHGYRADNT